jgi:hypothetical protein
MGLQAQSQTTKRHSVAAHRWQLQSLQAPQHRWPKQRQQDSVYLVGSVTVCGQGTVVYPFSTHPWLTQAALIARTMCASLTIMSPSRTVNTFVSSPWEKVHDRVMSCLLRNTLIGCVHVVRSFLLARTVDSCRPWPIQAVCLKANLRSSGEFIGKDHVECGKDCLPKGAFVSGQRSSRRAELGLIYGKGKQLCSAGLETKACHGTTICRRWSSRLPANPSSPLSNQTSCHSS